ncbi:MAG: DNA-binding protein [Promethearchaeota archaeon]
MEDEDLQEIRRKKIQEMQAQAARQQQEQAMQERVESQKQLIMMKILTPEARQRLMNIKLARPHFAESIEAQLIQIAQTGQLGRLGIPVPISDEHFKQILNRITGTKEKRDFRIKKI